MYDTKAHEQLGPYPLKLINTRRAQGRQMIMKFCGKPSPQIHENTPPTAETRRKQQQCKNVANDALAEDIHGCISRAASRKAIKTSCRWVVWRRITCVRFCTSTSKQTNDKQIPSRYYTPAACRLGSTPEKKTRGFYISTADSAKRQGKTGSRRRTEGSGRVHAEVTRHREREGCADCHQRLLFARTVEATGNNKHTNRECFSSPAARTPPPPGPLLACPRHHQETQNPTQFLIDPDQKWDTQLDPPPPSSCGVRGTTEQRTSRRVCSQIPGRRQPAASSTWTISLRVP